MITWPAPASEPPSPDYNLTVDGEDVFVYQAPVRAEILQNDGLWTHTADYRSERAAFAIFDTTDGNEVVIKPTRAFRSAMVLPERAGIVPTIVDGTVRFRLQRAQHLTVLLDDSDVVPLHLFIGEPETPPVNDVIYYGPGVHEVETLEVKSGQTVYIAGGAIVRGVLRPGEVGEYSEKWKVKFYNGRVLSLLGVENVRICGRGILDASLIPHPGRSMIGLNKCRNVVLSGITLRNAANWNVTISRSSDVMVDDLRIISGRLNTDGINTVNSRQVKIRRCFVRNHDDSIVAKTLEADAPCEDVTVEDCVVWNDWGYALGATYEVRSPIRRLTFRRCDIIATRHFCLGIHVSDSGTVSEVAFEDIAVSDLSRITPQPLLAKEAYLLRCVVTSDVWGKDAERGHIRNVRLERVRVAGKPLPSHCFGVDAEHGVENIELRDVQGALPVRVNEFVRGLRCD